MKFKKKKLFSIINYILLVPLVFLIILFIGSVLPITGNYKVMTVLSGSMEPAINVGSMVVSKPFDDYKIGEVITFKTSKTAKTPVTHRIAEIEVIEGNPIYTTKGDANNAPDQRVVQKKDIIGKVILNIPYLGYALDFVKKPIGFILIVFVPAGLIILDEARKIYKEVKKKKNKKKEIEEENINENK